MRDFLIGGVIGLLIFGVGVGSCAWGDANGPVPTEFIQPDSGGKLVSIEGHRRTWIDASGCTIVDVYGSFSHGWSVQSVTCP